MSKLKPQEIFDSNLNLELIVLGVFTCLSLIYIVVDRIFHEEILIFFSWIYASIAYVAAFMWLFVRNVTFFSDYRITAVAALVLSTSYLLVSYYLKTERKFTSLLLESVGYILLYGSIFSLLVDIFWLEIFYSLVVFVSLYLSSYIKSKLMLAVATIYLVIIIFYLNRQ